MKEYFPQHLTFMKGFCPLGQFGVAPKSSVVFGDGVEIRGWSHMFCGPRLTYIAFSSSFKAIESLFWKLQCDHSALENMLGGTTTARDENVAIYLGLIEQKANDLLTMYSFSLAEVCKLAWARNNYYGWTAGFPVFSLFVVEKSPPPPQSRWSPWKRSLSSGMQNENR